MSAALDQLAILSGKYTALQASHARLLEALAKVERRTFAHKDDDDDDRKRNLYHAHSIARQAIAAAQPFTET